VDIHAHIAFHSLTLPGLHQTAVLTLAPLTMIYGTRHTHTLHMHYTIHTLHYTTHIHTPHYIHYTTHIHTLHYTHTQHYTTLHTHTHTLGLGPTQWMMLVLKNLTQQNRCQSCRGRIVTHLCLAMSWDLLKDIWQVSH